MYIMTMFETYLRNKEDPTELNSQFVTKGYYSDTQLFRPANGMRSTRSLVKIHNISN